MWDAGGCYVGTLLFVVSFTDAVIWVYLLLLLTHRVCFFFSFFLFFNSTARHVRYRSGSLTWSCFRHPHFELRKTQTTHRNGAAFLKPVVNSEQREMKLSPRIRC